MDYFTTWLQGFGPKKPKDDDEDAKSSSDGSQDDVSQDAASENLGGVTFEETARNDDESASTGGSGGIAAAAAQRGFGEEARRAIQRQLEDASRIVRSAAPADDVVQESSVMDERERRAQAALARFPGDAAEEDKSDQEGEWHVVTPDRDEPPTRRRVPNSGHPRSTSRPRTGATWPTTPGPKSSTSWTRRRRGSRLGWSILPRWRCRPGSTRRRAGR